MNREAKTITNDDGVCETCEAKAAGCNGVQVHVVHWGYHRRPDRGDTLVLEMVCSHNLLRSIEYESEEMADKLRSANEPFRMLMDIARERGYRVPADGSDEYHLLLDEYERM